MKGSQQLSLSLHSLLPLAVAILGTSLLCACHTNSAGVKQRVIVGVDHSPPFYLIQPDQSVRGLAFDVLNEAARRRHIELVWTPLSNVPLDEALARRQVQLWPLVSPTPERQAQFYLSEPWLESDYVLVSRKEHPVRSVAGSRGVTVAHGRLRMSTLIAHRFLPDSRLVVFQTRTQAVESVCRGENDAALLETRILDAMLLERPPACHDTAFQIVTVSGATSPLSLAAVPEVSAAARALRDEISVLAEDGFLNAALDAWAPFSAENARSAWANRAAEQQTRFFRLLTLIIGVSAILLALMMRRARALQRTAQATAQALEAEKQRFYEFMRHSPAVSYIKDERGRLLYINDPSNNLSRDFSVEWENKSDGELWPPDVVAQLSSNDQAVFNHNRTIEVVEDIPLPIGLRHFLSVKFPFSDQHGRRLLGGLSLDITERLKTEQQREQLLGERTALLDSAGSGIFGLDNAGLCTFINPRAAELLGYTCAESLGQEMHDLIHRYYEDGSPYPRSACPVSRACDTGQEARVEHEVFWRKDGSPLAVSYHVRPIWVEGRKQGAIITFDDATARRERESTLRTEARIDPLTGIANRREFKHQLRLTHQAIQSQDTSICVALCDIDHFKQINDRYGHAAGDEVLAVFGQLLQTHLRRDDLPGRLGGDEFAILMPGTTAADAAACLDRLRSHLETLCFGLNLPAPFNVTATFGIAQCHRRQTTDEWLAAADRSLYLAKDKGRNQIVCA